MTLQEAVDILDKFIASISIEREFDAWAIIRKEIADALKPSHNNARDEICPVCSSAMINVSVNYECNYCHKTYEYDCSGQTSPVA